MKSKEELQELQEGLENHTEERKKKYALDQWSFSKRVSLLLAGAVSLVIAYMWVFEHTPPNTFILVSAGAIVVMPLAISSLFD